VSDDDTHLRFLARAQEPNRWGGEAPLPALDVEGALASVLARAGATQAGAPALSGPETLPQRQLARRARPWTRALAASLLLVGGFAPWLASVTAPEPREQAANALAGVSTAAVVFAENSGSLKG